MTPSISRISLQIRPPRHRRSPRGVTHSDEPDLRSDPAPPEERVGRFLLPQMPSTQGVPSLFPELFWSSTDFVDFSTAPPGSSTRHPPVRPQPAPSNVGRTGAIRARLFDRDPADRVDHSGGNAAITQVATYSAGPSVHMLGIGPTRSSRRLGAGVGPDAPRPRPGRRDCWREITGLAESRCDIAPTVTRDGAPRSQARLGILTRRVRRPPCRRGT